LECFNNQIIFLNISNNYDLTYLVCDNNQITNLDVSNNINLSYLRCYSNQITNLNLSNNPALTELYCGDNMLYNLDLRNGHNNYIDDEYLHCDNNPNLTCINVDDAAWSTSNWTSNIDPQHYFDTNCPPSSIQEHTTNKELLKVTDLLGRETKRTNQPLFYIYDDGTVKKRIVIE